jgi:WD40 repeat protein
VVSNRLLKAVLALSPLLMWDPVITCFAAPPAESTPGRATVPDPQSPKAKQSDVLLVDHLLGISPDFTTCAVSDGGGVRVVAPETGKLITSLKWDRDWGQPVSAAVGKDVVAVTADRDSVKVFSLKTGELEQNVRGKIDAAVIAVDGRRLAITEFRPGEGYYLLLRDIQEKKSVAEVRLGSNGQCSLAVAGNRVAAYEGRDDQITLAEADTGKVLKKLKSGNFRKVKEFSLDRTPLAISPAGNILGCGADDVIVLYDLNADKVARKVEGHLDVVRALAFSPDGTVLASVAKDKTIRFWNTEDGKEVGAIKDLPGGASDLTFSADGKRIAVVYRPDEFRPERKAEIRKVELK